MDDQGAAASAPADPDLPNGQAEENPRRTFFHAAAPLSPIVAAPAGDATFLVSTTDTTVGRSLFVNGERNEMRTLPHVIAILREVGMADRVDGRVFLDVGANVGTTCITALKTFGFNSAVACEPEPSNYRLLELNSILNGVEDRLVTLPVAVSDIDGEAGLIVNPRNSGGHALLSARGAKPAAELVTVDAVTLDHLVERGILRPERVGLVWVDTQGAEGHVLSGAGSLVRSGVPFVLEVHTGMLDRSGGRERLEEIISSSYTHFVDLRRHHREKVLTLEDAVRIGQFTAELAETKAYSDIMVLRLDRVSPPA